MCEEAFSLARLLTMSVSGSLAKELRTSRFSGVGLHGARGWVTSTAVCSQVRSVRQFLLLALFFLSLLLGLQLLKDTSSDQGRQALQWTSGMFVICRFPLERSL